MSAVLTLDPRIYEFETTEAEAAYDVWLKNKVQQSMNSQAAKLSHDEVVAIMRDLCGED